MNDLDLLLLYEDELFFIHLHKELALLQLTFRTQPEPERFRNAYRLAIDAALNKEVHYWLTDARQIKVMLSENQTWLKVNMQPVLQPAKIRKFAIVMSPECFVMTNPNQVYNQPEPGLVAPPAGVIKVTFDREAAWHWLFNAE
ncbi:hypothetical protein [Adhaeribacter pallidiroseus]|uniref:Uncharacterized protein n=1 Tax=Adhaeribacter pallidiroseus TaxID=2072847 RepID=A0A369QU33_9BACT|nr:hypothetical protein [Adhaeribacter pallidiroseus]RDC66319.1 hypothetical protein AHMF7616_04950 [Adhaeribacter pallidiroseus]